MALGILLAEGIGDTIRVSLVAPPPLEVKVGKEILANLQPAQSRPNLIACPTCGRLEINMMPMVQKVEAALQRVRRPKRKPITVSSYPIHRSGKRVSHIPSLQIQFHKIFDI